ncbi:hypothetical protein [Paraglaciecola sp. L3A3]|uniref:hypothetical protein n=1 Tax=Paraglaciecola sp. L3A3 TaxID=2686358 RepID=UPI00131BF832|nr:hypothetical protein [Paraglaciecola sp. L3A3]
MKFYKYLVLLFTLSFSFSVLSEEPKHDDKEHKKAESNLDHKHWEKAHGSATPEKKEGRKPSVKPSKKSDSARVIRE